MLVITKSARQKLNEISQHGTSDSEIHDMKSGVRIQFSAKNNGSRDSTCRIGIDRRREDDQVQDVGGMKLLIDPLTFAYLRRIRAILDLSQNGTEEELVLIVEGIGN